MGEAAGAGHNSEGVAADRLRSFVQRIERAEDEKRDIAEQIKDIYAEAKGSGFDIKTIREVVRLRRMKPADRSEREELLEIYKAALGMIADLPLGQAALARAAA